MDIGRNIVLASSMLFGLVFLTYAERVEIVSSPGSASAAEHLTFEDPARVESLVVTLYDDFSEVASWAGDETACRAHSFVHRTPRDLETARHADLLANAQRLRVDVAVTQRKLLEATENPDKLGGPPRTRLRNLRPEVELSVGEALDLEPFAELPAVSVLAVVEEQRGDRYEIQRVTTFDVECVSESWQSEHRASLFSLKARASGSEPAAPELLLDLQDPVAQVAHVVQQAGSSFRQADEKRIAHEAEDAPLPMQKMECFWSHETQPLVNTIDARSTRHNYGLHRISTDADVTLTCSTSCYAECRPRIKSMTCTDSGDPTGVGVTSHTLNRSTVGIDGTAFNGNTAHCGVANACGIGECRFGICSGTGLGLNWSGTGFTFTSSSKNFDELQRQGVSNGACVQRPEPGGTCRSLNGSQLVAISLAPSSQRVEPSRSIMAADFPLTRRVTNRRGGEVSSWLVGEAAVVSVKNGRAHALRQTTPLAAFANRQDTGVLANLPATAALNERKDYLLVAFPEHPQNSRHTTPPRLLLDSSRELEIEEEGRFVVSAFFEPDGTIRSVSLVDVVDGFESLHTDDGALTEEGFLALGDAVGSDLLDLLSIQHTGHQQHAAVAVAVLAVKPNGKLRLDDSFTYIPRCCCGDWFCA